MEDNKGKLVASNEAWTLDLPKLPHRHKAWRRRPVGHTGEGWICSADNAQRRSWCRHRGCLLDPLSVPRRGLGRNGEPGLYNDIELADDHFKPITKVLDSLFQHEEEVELPERCQEFFEQFQREHQEELQAYLVRHQTMVKQLKDLLAGWHLLMRAGIPRWIHPQVQSICNGELTTEKVSRALRTMFNGDSKPSQGYHLQAWCAHGGLRQLWQRRWRGLGRDLLPWWWRDLLPVGRWILWLWLWGWDQLRRQHDGAKKMSHQSLMKQVWQLRDASINYLDSRKKMRELCTVPRVLSCGRPLTLNDNNFGGRGSGKSYGKSRNNGAVGKGKGKSREKVARVNARAVEKELDTFCPEPEDLSSAEDFHRRTTHRHPRWQGRLQVEALPSMDHGSKDIDFQHLASRKSLTTPTSPTETTPVPGGFHRHEVEPQELSVVKQSGTSLNGYLNMRGMEAEITKDPRDFRFRDGVTVRSQFCARTPVCVGKVWRDLVIHVLPGHTPLLLARPDLESWNIMVDYGEKLVYVDGCWDQTPHLCKWPLPDQHLRRPEQHPPRWRPLLQVKQSLTETEVFPGHRDFRWHLWWRAGLGGGRRRRHDRRSDLWSRWEEQDSSANPQILGGLCRRGQLGQIPQAELPHVEVSQFSLPRWNFEDREIQRDFRKLAAQDHIMGWWHRSADFGPPMQNLNYRTPERRAPLQDLRNLEEETHLKFYENVHADPKKIDFDCTLEQPADATPWLTPTLENMKGNFETVLDRCRTGLKASPDDPRFVRKPTKFRSTSKTVCVGSQLEMPIRHRSHADDGPRSCSQGHAELWAWLGSALGWCNLWVYGRDLEATEDKLSSWHWSLWNTPTRRCSIWSRTYSWWRSEDLKSLKTVALLRRQLGYPNGAKLVFGCQNQAHVWRIRAGGQTHARRYKVPTMHCKSSTKSDASQSPTLQPHSGHWHVLHWVGQGETSCLHHAGWVQSLWDRLWDQGWGCWNGSWTVRVHMGQELRLPKRFWDWSAFGPHQSETYAEWVSNHGIKMELIPRPWRMRILLTEERLWR